MRQRPFASLVNGAVTVAALFHQDAHQPSPPVL